MKIITFINPNGIKVEGVILYISKVYKEETSINKYYDKIVYAEKSIVKLRYTLTPTDLDKDIYKVCPNPEVKYLLLM